MSEQSRKSRIQLYHYGAVTAGMLACSVSYADIRGFQPMTNEEMSATVGQALFNLTYIAPNDQGNPNHNIGFYRLGMEADLEVNANINKLQLGCGGINGAGGCDIDLDHVRLTGMVNAGAVDAGPRSDFLAKNPFLEFAIRNPDQAATREVVGLRLGFMEAFGKMTIGEPYNYNPQNLSFTKNNDPNTHTGINSISGDLGLGLVNSLVPLQACALTGANADRSACNSGLQGLFVGNATINVDDPNPGDNRFNLALGRASSVNLEGIKVKYLGAVALQATWQESLRFVHEIALGNDANGNGTYDPGEATRDFVLFTLSGLGDNQVSNNQFTNPNNLKWQRVSNPTQWYASPRGWSLSAPSSVELGNTTTRAVNLGLGEIVSALAGFTLELGNLDAGLRPVDNCAGSLTFC